MNRPLIEELVTDEDPDAGTPRMIAKLALRWAQEDFPDFTPVGNVDNVDVVLEALIHPETYEIQVKLLEED